MFKVQPTQKWLHEKILRNLGPERTVIAYPERNCFRLGSAQGIPKQIFREIWVEIGEIFKQNLGDSGAKLWSGAKLDAPRPSRDQRPGGAARRSEKFNMTVGQLLILILMIVIVVIVDIAAAAAVPDWHWHCDSY